MAITLQQLRERVEQRNEAFTPPPDRSWERHLGTEREPANEPKPLHLPKISQKAAPEDFNDYHKIMGPMNKPRLQDNRVNEEVLEESFHAVAKKHGFENMGSQGTSHYFDRGGHRQNHGLIIHKDKWVHIDQHGNNHNGVGHESLDQHLSKQDFTKKRDHREEDAETLDEDFITEAAKAKKAKKAKPKPYDFMKHLNDVAKGGEMKNAPLRFGSGERMRVQPEEAAMILGVHKTMNGLNQMKTAKMMRTNKNGFRFFRAFALGRATVPK